MKKFNLQLSFLLALNVAFGQNAEYGFESNNTALAMYSNNYTSIDIDHNNNSTSKYFLITNDGGINTLFKINENGHIGIGTTSPSVKLHVKGDGSVNDLISAENGGISIKGGNSTAHALRFDDTGGVDRHLVYVDASNNVKIGNSNFNDLYLSDQDIVLTNANLGIGISDPSSALHIHGTGGGNSGYRLSNDYDAVRGYFANNTNNSDYIITYNGTGSPEISLQSDGDVILAEGGNVGIGTASPQSIVHTKSDKTQLHSTEKTDSNMLIESVSTSKNTNEGAALGFVVPAKTDGSNTWEQGRILVTPDNSDDDRADGRMYIQTRSRIDSQWKWTNNLVLRSSGNVGIGTTDTFGYRLAVNGTIGATEVKVETTSAWPDFVFDKDYELRTLDEVEKHIQSEGHLPEIPSEAEVLEEGINLGEMNAKLLQKIEELTLYLIEQNKRLDAAEKEIAELKEGK